MSDSLHEVKSKSYQEEDVDLKTISDKLNQLVSSFIERIEKNIAVILIFLILGVAWQLGEYLFEKARPKYRTVALIQSNVLSDKEFESLLFVLNNIFQANDTALYARQTKIEDESKKGATIAIPGLREIKSVVYENFSHLEDSPRDINLTKGRSVFKIEVYTENREISREIEDIVMLFLNNNELTKRKQLHKLKQLNDYQVKLENDTRKFDHLDSSLFTTKSSRHSNLVFLGSNNVNPVEINQRSIFLFEELANLNELIDKIRSHGSFQLIGSFVTPIKPYNIPEITVQGILKRCFVGFIFGYLFILYIERRKSKKTLTKNQS